MNSRHLLASLGLATAATLGGACSGAVGEMLIDAGTFLSDAGDAGAQTSTVMEAACDVEQVVRRPDGVSITRYAEFVVPGLRPEEPPTITAVACGFRDEPDSTQKLVGCPDGAQCSGPVTPQACFLGSFVLASGRIFVECGLRSETTSSVFGRRAALVRLRIEP